MTRERAPRHPLFESPSWITSVGTAVACLGVAITLWQNNSLVQQQQGAQVEAQRRTDEGEAHLRQAQQRLWDHINVTDAEHARQLEHLRETLRAEILGDLRREIDVRCHAGGVCAAQLGRTHVQ